MAEILVDPTEYELLDLGIAAGQPDVKKMKHVNGIFIVEGISQADLETAFASATKIDKLSRLKSVAKNRVDTNAGLKRGQLLTGGPGQAIIYLKKEIDAENFKAAGYPEVDIDDYPWIAAEARARSDSGEQVADLIIANAAAFVSLAIEIEEERIRGKVEIDQQQSADGVNNATDKAKDKIKDKGK